jgi:site-specific DNA recombinase
MKRAVLYARTSRDDRDTDGRNLASQLEMCREYAAAQNWHITEELSEDERGVSGADADAPKLRRALDLAGAGDIDVLICREMDRLARSVAKQLHVEDVLKSHNVEIAYVLADYDDTPEGQLNKHIRAVISEYERIKITERMIRGRENAVKTGNVMLAQRVPFGYKLAQVNGKRILVIDEDTAPWVRRMFNWYAHGDGEKVRLSFRDISDRLTAAGVLTPADRNPIYTHKKRGRGEWNPGSISRMLRNPVYCGRWTHNAADGRELVVEVEPLVGLETWEAVQRQMERNRIMSARNAKRDYLLRSRMLCGQCGYRMQRKTVAARGKTWQYYRCPTANKDRKVVIHCGGTSVRADTIEERTWELIALRFEDPDKLAASFDEYQRRADKRDKPGRQQPDRIDEQIAKHVGRLGRLMNLHLDGEFSQEVFYSQQREIEHDLAALHRQRERIARTLNTQDDGPRIATLLEFAREIRLADVTEYQRRRWVIDTLNIYATIHADRTATVTVDGIPIGIIDCD